MAAAGTIVAKIEAGFAKIWGGAKDFGGAAKEAGGHAKGFISKGDDFVSGHIRANDGSFGKALKGIAQQKPVTSAVVATAAVGGTVYAGKQVFGRHSERVMRERANDNERTR